VQVAARTLRAAVLSGVPPGDACARVQQWCVSGILCSLNPDMSQELTCGPRPPLWTTLNKALCHPAIKVIAGVGLGVRVEVGLLEASPPRLLLLLICADMAAPAVPETRVVQIDCAKDVSHRHQM